ncbi:MAG TPA: 50S ribosomal protein L4 [Nanoarchaeota archaeon]|nr:50S ribosomal protein L4P [uncultured archaeon]HIH14252.1 50S ribosomal protein L4 [Nanoarchaeota archaeon]
MKAQVYTVNGEKSSEVELPAQFSEPIRSDLIKRAALAVRSTERQQYGTDPLAGTKQGKHTSKRRHRYGGTYGIGTSRIKRKVMWKRGSRFGFVGAFVVSAVKGRAAFPPTSERIFEERINIKEKRKAVRSAIAATAVRELVALKHKIDGIKSIPLAVEDSFENIKKTKDIISALEKLGLAKELERIQEKTIRAGKGKMRGRKYRRKLGPLIIISKTCYAEKAAGNIPGVEIVQVKHLNANLLAPGTHAGRLAVWTKSAIEILGKDRLFI